MTFKATPLSLVIALSGLLATLGAHAEPADYRLPGEQLAWHMLDDVVRISAQAQAGATGEQGFGFVVGERGSNLIIVTADHVVRDSSGKSIGDILVTFHDQEGTSGRATLLNLRLPHDHGDLAVLELPHPNGYAVSWPRTASTDVLEQGTKALRIGKQERWVPSAIPGQFVGLQGAVWLAFDDLDTPRGSSGGPVVTNSGIIGLVIADGGESGAPDEVLPIGTIEMQLKLWNLPWNLAASASPVRLPTPHPSADEEPPATADEASQPAAAAPRDSAMLEASARAFIISYYAGLSAGWQTVEPILAKAIADPIMFYGRSTSRSVYLAQQSSYFQRWPSRALIPQSDQLAVRCEPVAGSCRISDRLNYDVSDPASGRRSTGSESVFLQIRRQADSFTITEEGKAPAAATPSFIFQGRWKTSAGGNCRDRYYIVSRDGDDLHFLDQSGNLDIEQVTSVSADGGTYLTQTMRSNHITGSSLPTGARWRYESQPLDQVLVHDLNSNRSFNLYRCQ